MLDILAQQSTKNLPSVQRRYDGDRLLEFIPEPVSNLNYYNVRAEVFVTGTDARGAEWKYHADTYHMVGKVVVERRNVFRARVHTSALEYFPEKHGYLRVGYFESVAIRGLEGAPRTLTEALSKVAEAYDPSKDNLVATPLIKEAA